MELDYFKNYDNCVEYCGDFGDQEYLKTCIEEIKETYNDYSLCKKTEEKCEVVETTGFKLLLEGLIQFFKLQYCSRIYYSNERDVDFITSLGMIELKLFGLTIQDLNCVKLQKFVKKGMPNNLGEYLVVMKEIKKILISNTDLIKRAKKNRILKNYEEFVSDFQPWSRLLVNCVNDYMKKINMPYEIPDIGKPKLYGDFISDYTKEQTDAVFYLLKKNPKKINNILKIVNCPQGKEINLKTGRCIKTKTLKPCPKGKERNPKTRRCNKTKKKRN